MRVFVTGATGFIGSVIVKDLIAAGHQVIGLSRSKEKAQALADTGAEVIVGTVQDQSCLRDGIARADGVIHTAFNHDFSKFVANCEDDRRVIETLAALLGGSDRPLITTSGTGIVAGSGRAATEEDEPVSSSMIPRAASEESAMSAAAKGVNASIMRLPQVHDTRKQGLITYAIAIAREKKLSAYIGDGSNRWPAAHVLDTARLYRLAVEAGERGARYHSVDEEGVSMREMAEVIGRKLKVPVASITPQEAEAHFGWLAMFAGRDLPASSAITRKKLGWNPTGPRLITDLEQMQEADLYAVH